jgi:hypothetical protein
MKRMRKSTRARVEATMARASQGDIKPVTTTTTKETLSADEFLALLDVLGKALSAGALSFETWKKGVYVLTSAQPEAREAQKLETEYMARRDAFHANVTRVDEQKS